MTGNQASATDLVDQAGAKKRFDMKGSGPTAVPIALSVSTSAAAGDSVRTLPSEATATERLSRSLTKRSGAIAKDEEADRERWLLPEIDSDYERRRAPPPIRWRINKVKLHVPIG